MDQNEIWSGSDDGKLYVTTDGGANWTDLSKKLKGLSKALGFHKFVLQSTRRNSLGSGERLPPQQLERVPIQGRRLR